METNKLKLNLIESGQIDLANNVNDALLIIDALINNSLIAEIENLPEAENGDAYLISGNKEKLPEFLTNKASNIAVYVNGWHFIEPKENMYFFINKQIIIYSDGVWQVLTNFKGEGVKADIREPASAGAAASEIPTLNSSKLKISPGKLQPIKGDVTIKNNNYLNYSFYLNGDSKIKLEDIKNFPVNIVIKQNYAEQFKIDWSDNILWPGKLKLTEIITNQLAVVTIYNMLENDFYLAKIQYENYQF